MQTLTARDGNQAAAAALSIEDAFDGEDALSPQESALLLGALLTLGSVIASLWVL